MNTLGRIAKRKLKTSRYQVADQERPGHLKKQSSDNGKALILPLINAALGHGGFNSSVSIELDIAICILVYQMHLVMSKDNIDKT